MKTFRRYCQFAEDLCPRQLPQQNERCLFFAYPSKPETSAEAIQGAISLVSNDENLGVIPIDWKNLPIEGNIIFCEICEAINKSNCVVLDTTYINFNIMFEYGYAIGTDRAIWPLVEEGVAKGARVYDTIETCTTVGYSGFANSQTIYTKIKKKTPWERQPKFLLPERLGKDPTRDGVGLLYLQNIQDNEPSTRITETLSSIQMGRIVDNPAETPFRPLSWYLNSLRRSYAVVVHLGNERAEGYASHWAKCALVSGLALSLGRRLLILGEDVLFSPIDYHDIVRSYSSASQAQEIINEFTEPISHVIFDFRKYFQYDIGTTTPRKGTRENILKDIDLGDYVADNEEESITEVFVETPQYLMALDPTFKVFIGRRGTGKTANFFVVLDTLLQDKRNIVCRIKPEGWQLDDFVSFVKTQLDKAKKGYLFQSLWKYMLYSEVIETCYNKIMETPVYGNLSQSEENIRKYVEEREDISEVDPILRTG